MASPRYYKLVEVTGNQGEAFDHSPTQQQKQPISPANRSIPPCPQVNGFAGQIPPRFQQQHQQQQQPQQQQYPQPLRQLQPLQIPHHQQVQLSPRIQTTSIAQGPFPTSAFPISAPNHSPFPDHSPFSTTPSPPGFSTLPTLPGFPTAFPNMPSMPGDMRAQMDAMRAQMMAEHHVGGAFPSISHAHTPMPTQNSQYPVLSEDPTTGVRTVSLRIDVTGYNPSELLINTDGETLDVYASRRTDSGSAEFRRQYQLPVAVRPNDIRCSFERDGWLVVEAFPTTSASVKGSSNSPPILQHHNVGVANTGGLLIPANGSLQRKKKRVTFSLQ